MLRIHTDNFVPKYVNGKWIWNEEKEILQFDSFERKRDGTKTEYNTIGGFKFMATVNQLEEMIFRQEYSKPGAILDVPFIRMRDVKNLVTFLAPSEFMRNDFLHFINTSTVNSFFKALCMYIDYFLKLVEFVLIRRDEISGDKARIQSDESSELKRNLSAHLTHYRILLARSYSKIILGTGDVKKFYHLKPIVNISQSIKDKHFHEMFIAFSIQLVWITMHWRSFDIIDAEINRLFRSEHFVAKRPTTLLKLTEAEESMLFGKNYKRCNYRMQNSPLIQELMHVEKEDMPILWIGNRKYRGTDMRIHYLELKYIVPVRQLSLCELSIGILGHPKSLYNTMLKLDWEAVRFHNFNENYDPYQIVTQPNLRLPPLNETEFRRKYAEVYETFYKLQSKNDAWSLQAIKKWLRRDETVQYFKTEGIITDIWLRCLKEVNDTSYGPNTDEIIKEFIARKEKIRKIK